MTVKPQAEVIAVYPNKVRICVDDLGSFTNGHPLLRVGSYLRVTDHEDCVLIAIIESFLIEVDHKLDRRHVIEALPLGVIKDGKFIRGGDALTIPPTGVEPATMNDIKKSLRIPYPKIKNSSFQRCSPILRSGYLLTETSSSTSTLPLWGQLVLANLIP